MVKGMQDAPAELEALLLKPPAVADAAVLGRPDERACEVAVACLVAWAALDIDALTAWLAERVAPHKQLADIVLVEAIPKNPSRKLLRRVLRAHDAAWRCPRQMRHFRSPSEDCGVRGRSLLPAAAGQPLESVAAYSSHSPGPIPAILAPP